MFASCHAGVKIPFPYYQRYSIKLQSDQLWTTNFQFEFNFADLLTVILITILPVMDTSTTVTVAPSSSLTTNSRPSKESTAGERQMTRKRRDKLTIVLLNATYKRLISSFLFFIIFLWTVNITPTVTIFCDWRYFLCFYNNTKRLTTSEVYSFTWK